MSWEREDDRQHAVSHTAIMERGEGEVLRGPAPAAHARIRGCDCGVLDCRVTRDFRREGLGESGSCGGWFRDM